MSATPIVICICGPSASGKTSLAQNLVKALPGKSVIVSQDNYYCRIKLRSVPHHPRFGPDYENPAGIDHNKFWGDIDRLRRMGASPPQQRHGDENEEEADESGEERKDIDSQHDEAQTSTVPLQFIIVEGFLVFFSPLATRHSDSIRIFLDATTEDHAQQLCKRRAARDLLCDVPAQFAEQSGQLAGFVDFYMSFVWTEYLKNREQQLAHMLADGKHQDRILIVDFDQLQQSGKDALMQTVLAFVLAKVAE